MPPQRNRKTKYNFFHYRTLRHPGCASLKVKASALLASALTYTLQKLYLVFVAVPGQVSKERKVCQQAQPSP
ncbi:hypothetical protein BBF96_09800 [Anoxybacter fermentans]|uniref:Uncharacterized protein n=1 Tax=Anoxybacter fermentans TaxID=1323375 RepID=A0A3S9SZ76_9FIRM|nr:hypothetical protein BBF96_09800 [Anoxybacter fermentans]